MPHALANSKDVQYALSQALEAAAYDFLISCAGQDLPDSMLTLDGFRFNVERFDDRSFLVGVASVETGDELYRYEVQVHTLKK